MCYDIRYLTERKLKIALHREADDELIAKLQAELDRLYADSPHYYHVNGFAHPRLPVITDAEPGKIQLFTWGLIPFWVKDDKTAVKIQNQTLNARGETIFEKPSFREAAKKRRCIILAEGFFEHHHFKGKTYPFHILPKKKDLMYLAGLWEKWTDKTDGQTYYTVSIVTSKANALMENIHNNPKQPGGRMPLILVPALAFEWLKTIGDPMDRKIVEELIQPYPENELISYTVPKLRGKDAVGNVVNAIYEFRYEELEEK